MEDNNGKQQNTDSISKSSSGSSVSTSELSAGQTTPPETTQSQNGHAKSSRRNLLKIGALAGGAVAAVGAATLAAQNLITRPTPSNKTQVQITPAGKLREYWVQAEAFQHNLVPNGKDGMMGMAFQANQSSFWAVGLRAF